MNQKDAEYPMRCVIIDPNGSEVMPGIGGIAPPKSIPHIGKHGIAERVSGSMSPRITLDDGAVLRGYECWWIPEDEWRQVRQDLGLPVA